MTRLIYCLGCWVAVFTLLGAGAAFAQSKSEDGAKPNDQKKAAAEKPAEKTAEKPAEEKKPAASEKKDEPEKKDEEKAAPPKPATHTVAEELFKISVTGKGSFESKTMEEVSVKPKEWKLFTVLEAVDHGVSVKKGDVLVKLDPEKLDIAISDHRTTLRLADLTLKQAEKSLEAIEKLAPVDMAFYERDNKEYEEDYKRFFKIDVPMSKKSAEFSLKSYEQMLAYEEEELRQLEKMYAADDLTEETEEIILTRQRNTVERARFYLEQAKIRHEETLELYLPRNIVQVEENKQRQAIGYQRTMASLPVALSQQQLEVEKQKVAQAQSKEKLDKLVADRELMVVKSPIDGVVYYGKFTRGTWSGAATAAGALKSGGKVTPEDVFMTIVKPQPLEVRTTVSEGDLRWFHSGLEGTVVPTAYPDQKLRATVTEVETVPFSAGKYEVLLKVRAKGDDLPMPGMACSATFIPYVEKKALTVPAKSVFTEELDPRRQFVYVVDEKGKQKKQRVTVGNKSGEKLEILEGLDKGDKILQERPKDE